GAGGEGAGRGRAQAAGGQHIMNRRAFLTTMSAVIAVAPLMGEAQQAGKVWRIGLLDYASDPASSSRWTALRDRLRELGYVEGQSAHFEARWSGGQMEGLRGLAAERGNAKVDVIVSAGTESTTPA